MGDKILGYCKECGTAIKKSHLLKCKCPTCGYPSDKNDLYDTLPDYLIEYRKQNGLDIE